MFKAFSKMSKTFVVLLGFFLFSSSLFAGDGLNGMINGFYIEPYKGNNFEKTNLNGLDLYAVMDISGSNVNIIIDPSIIPMDEYLDINLEQIKLLGFSASVVSKSENSAVVSTSLGPIKQKQRYFHDVKNNRTIIVTGTYISASQKSAVIQCVDSARLVEE